MHLSVYIGPFLDIPFVLKTSSEVRKTCVEGCKLHDTALRTDLTKFCPECGHKTSTYEKKLPLALTELSLFKLPSAYEDHLFSISHDKGSYWVPNKRQAGVFLSQGNLAFHDLENSNPKQAMSDFCEKVEGILAWLKSNYEIVPTVRFGAIPFE